MDCILLVYRCYYYIKVSCDRNQDKLKRTKEFCFFVFLIFRDFVITENF